MTVDKNTVLIIHTNAIGITVIYVALLVRIWLKWMRHSESLSASIATGCDVSRAKALIGRSGVTLTPLRPAGIARIEGEHLDVVALGDFLGTDEEVSVVEVSGNRIVVRRTGKPEKEGHGP